MFTRGDVVTVLPKAKEAMSGRHLDKDGNNYYDWACDMDFIINENAIGEITEIEPVNYGWCEHALVKFNDDEDENWWIPTEFLTLYVMQSVARTKHRI